MTGVQTCALPILGHRVKEDTERSIRWGLGLPSDQDANEVTIILGEKMLRGHARVAGRTGPARRIAAADLRSFIERAVFWIKRQDAEALVRLMRECPDIRSTPQRDWELSQSVFLRKLLGRDVLPPNDVAAPIT